ncbi:MAG: XkdX family protein [Lachnospiraceae bacterium]|nr:XkdX family protein [Lachnospiraceae bacterium]
MEHSKKFDKVKNYYNTIVNGERLWNEARVRNAVVKGWITEEEFNEITGGDY